MSKDKSITHRYKPGIPKRALLFVAGAVWTFAGGMLLYKGFGMLTANPQHIWIKLIISIILGTAFYILLFDKISLKHTNRIKSIEHEKPCFFSFFGWKGYLMMSMMITLGVILRKTGAVSPDILSVVYIMMGIPLTISALRFYLNGFSFHK